MMMHMSVEDVEAEYERRREALRNPPFIPSKVPFRAGERE
jgi:hypothetical protein